MVPRVVNLTVVPEAGWCDKQLEAEKQVEGYKNLDVKG